MYKVHCMNRISQAGINQLYGNFAPAEGLHDAEAVMVRSANMHDEVLPPQLLAIARAGAGVNNIPIERCTEQGIVVFNTPGANANGVKEMVIAGMLLASRDIVGSITWVQDHADQPDIAKAAESAKSAFGGTEIAGKTLGVIGLGAIGAMVANAGRSLGMHVLGYDPYLSVEYAWSLDRHVHAVTNVRDILEQSDFITIHVPANDKTRQMIGRDQILLMKHGVVFLNFARDILVDEEAMADALASGHVARYVTDFANPLTTHMEHAIVTSHLGASTVESEDNCAAMAISELRDYLFEGNITNSVNFGNVNLGPIETDERIVVLHRNVPNMIGNFSAILTDHKLNIENMANKRRDAVATTLLETSGEWDDTVIERIRALPDVFCARMIPGIQESR